MLLRNANNLIHYHQLYFNFLFVGLLLSIANTIGCMSAIIGILLIGGIVHSYFPVSVFFYII